MNGDGRLKLSIDSNDKDWRQMHMTPWVFRCECVCVCVCVYVRLWMCYFCCCYSVQALVVQSHYAALGCPGHRSGICGLSPLGELEKRVQFTLRWWCCSSDDVRITGSPLLPLPSAIGWFQLTPSFRPPPLTHGLCVPPAREHICMCKAYFFFLSRQAAFFFFSVLS